MTLSDQRMKSLHDAELHSRIAQFLGTEAMLLDEGRFEEWLTLLDEGMVYEVHLRVAADSRADEVPAGSCCVRDTKQMIRTRIDRIATSFAHAESPPSRTVRSVGSICLVQIPEADVVQVSSTSVVYRHRAIDPAPDVIHVRRNDRIRIMADGARLLARSVLLAETVLSTPNLAIFL